MKQSRKLLFGKTLFLAFVITVVLTVILVYFTGLPSHRSILNNSVISLTILAISFFAFLTYGLYIGLDVIDNYSHKLQIIKRRAWKKIPYHLVVPDVGAPSVGDGIGGIILGILLWILVLIAIFVLLLVFHTVLWFTFILLAIALYWIIIRSLKFIFSKSAVCVNDLPKSVAYAFGYTILYTSWLYALVFLSTLIQ